MARYPAPDPEQVEYAKQRVKAGASVREISKEFAEMGYKVLPMTVSRWSRLPEPEEGAGSTAGREPNQAKPAEQSPPPPLTPPAPRRPNLTEALAQRQANTPPPTPAPPIDASDTVGTLRMLLESFMADAHRERGGNPRLATTLAKSAAEVLDQIRKIEASKAEDLSNLKISRAAIAEAARQKLELFKTICARPLLCSRCSRELSIAWGEAHEKVAEADRGEGA